MKGHVSKRCGCRDDDGRQLGRSCPLLKRSGHGRWGYVVDLGTGPDGKRRQRRGSSFATRDEANAELVELLKRLGDGTHTEDGGMTVGRWLEAWLDGRQKIRASTADSYRQHLRLYLIPGLGHIRLDKLRTSDVEQLYSAMRALGTGRGGDVERRLLTVRNPKARLDKRRPNPATIARVHATLRAAMNTAVKRRMIPQNVASFVELETAVRPPVRVWTAEQASAFLDATATDRLAALWQLILECGLRRGEALGLRWQSVDLDAGVLRVDEQLTQVRRELVSGPPKSRSGARWVSLSDDLAAALRAHRSRQNTERLAFGASWVDTGRVFTTPDGTDLRPDSISQRFERLAKRAGLPVIRLHDLRHSSASIGLQAGESLHEIKERLGHSSIALTSDTYTHVLPAVARDAADRRSRLIRRHAVTTDVTTPPNRTVVTPKPTGETAGQPQWGGSDSNRRPRDYENDDPATGNAES